MASSPQESASALDARYQKVMAENRRLMAALHGEDERDASFSALSHSRDVSMAISPRRT